MADQPLKAERPGCNTTDLTPRMARDGNTQILGDAAPVEFCRETFWQDPSPTPADRPIHASKGRLQEAGIPKAAGETPEELISQWMGKRYTFRHFKGH